MSSPSPSLRSAAQSRASTPGSSSDVVEQLTPRSKVKALLAAVDDNSDTASPQKLNEQYVRFNSETLQELALQPKTKSFSVDEANEDNDDDEVVVPRGKLARRLHASAATKQPEDALAASEDGDAYNRVKRLIQRQEEENELQQADVDKELGNEDLEQPKRFGGFLRRKRKSEISADIEESHGSIPQSPLQKAHSPGEDAQQTEFPQTEGASSSLQAKAGSVDDDDDDDGSEPDLPSNLLKNDRFLALVARKREERKTKEAAEEAKRAALALSNERAKHNGTTSDASEVDSADEDDEENLKLTQRSRPTRKASKKAMEEMARETQRMSRNMQLAHEARTRKKITKDSLLARFKTKRSPVVTQVQASSSTVNSSAPNSDTEAIHDKNTPLTTPEKSQSLKTSKHMLTTLVPETSLLQPDGEEELPTVGDLLNSKTLDKGKGKDPAYYSSEPALAAVNLTADQPTTVSDAVPKGKKASFTQRPIKLRPPKNPVPPARYLHDSDSDLEVVPSKNPLGKTTIFDQLPAITAKAEQSLIKLQALAHISLPKKQHRKSGQPSMTSIELGSTLRRQARQQAARERSERIEELRKKGVVIQTSEERQLDQLAVEDMLEKARLEAQELAKKEKEEVREEKRANGEEVAFDSSDDEDYEEDGDAQAEDDASVELSGSEEEHNDEGEEDDVGDEEEDDEIIDEDEENAVQKRTNGFVDDIASGDEEEEEEEIEDEDEEVSIPRNDESDEELDIPQVQRRRKATRIVDDEDEDEDLPQKPTVIAGDSPVVANPFGQQAGAVTAPMGLTQAFAATMADSQLSGGNEEDSLAALGALSAPDFPDIEMDSLVKDSQAQDTMEAEIDLHLTQSQIQPDSVPLERVPVLTQFSQIPDPTQDEGFEQSSPITSRFIAAPPSTVDTVIVQSNPVPEPPVVKRKSRLRKRTEAVAVFSDEEEANKDVAEDAEERAAVDQGFAISADAFDVLKKGSKKAKKREQLYNKTKSEAKGMVEEQAVESEDEYAGLGGASDDSEGEEDEEVRKMIDKGHVDVDERKIAAYYAEKSRASDEAAISKLYRDINSGALRRKRGAGADFDDLDDSDDDVEARQRRKRREFARMRKALLDGDTNVGKIAEDPKKAAFLRAIEDRENEDDEAAEFLNGTPRDGASQGEEEKSQDIIPDSQAENRPPPTSTKLQTTDAAAAPSLKRKRPLTESLPQAQASTNLRANARRRRPSAIIAHKPTTLADIRASVSFLTEEPNALLNPVGPSPFDPSSDIEMDDRELDAELDALASTGQTPGMVDTRDMNEERHMSIAEPANAGMVMQQPPAKNNPRRTAPGPVPAFVDRLSLKRESSSFNALADPATGVGGGSNLAFFANASSATAGGFKVPSLIRRATSAFSAAADEYGISTHVMRSGGGGKGGGGGKEMAAEASAGRVSGAGGGRKSSVNWYAREQERKEILERRRTGNASNGKGGVRGVKGGRGVRREGTGLGNLLGRGGSWE